MPNLKELKVTTYSNGANQWKAVAENFCLSPGHGTTEQAAIHDLINNWNQTIWKERNKTKVLVSY